MAAQVEPLLQSFNVLGVNVSAINMDMALETIDRWIAERSSKYVTVTGVHGVVESQSDDGLRRIFHEAGMVTPDGMPMVWIGRRRGFGFIDRVYGPDLMLAVCERSRLSGYRHFFYGGSPGVPERLQDRLLERYPGLKVVGIYSPPFRAQSEEERAAVVQMINDAGPDIVWVGLGMPKQERWMAEHVGLLNAPVLIGVGAAFDFHAGVKKQAPRWMQRSGLEWSFRLMTEPRRLWRRYLKTNSLFLLLMAMEAVGIKRYEPDPQTEQIVPRGKPNG